MIPPNSEVNRDGSSATATAAAERGISNRGISNRGASSENSPQSDQPASTSQSAPQVFDFSSLSDAEWEAFDLMAEVENQGPGKPPQQQLLSLGEVMIRVMEGWMKSANLPYPKVKAKPAQSGIGPVRRPHDSHVYIGGKQYKPSLFRSCSPTTFRALMEALDYHLPDNRDMERDSSVHHLYLTWQCSTAVYGETPLRDIKGAVQVMVEENLAEEIVLGGQTQLQRGDILQTWTLRKGGGWGGHSSIVVSVSKNPKIISATLGPAAIQITPISGYARYAASSSAAEDDVPGLKRIYVARPTLKVPQLV